jgi:hypothetical protein
MPPISKADQIRTFTGTYWLPASVARSSPILPLGARSTRLPGSYNWRAGAAYQIARRYEVGRIARAFGPADQEVQSATGAPVLSCVSMEGDRPPVYLSPPYTSSLPLKLIGPEGSHSESSEMREHRQQAFHKIAAHKAGDRRSVGIRHWYDRSSHLQIG